MFTKCPNCKTLFKISDDQLMALEGMVRCGFCYGTFNALDALYEEQPVNHAAQAPESDQEYEELIETPLYDTEAQPNLDGDDLEEYDALAEQETYFHETPQPVVPQFETANTPTFATEPALPSPQAKPRPQPQPQLSSQEQEPQNSSPPDLLDAINIAGRDLQAVSRLQLDTNKSFRHKHIREMISTVTWPLATLAMVGLFFVQYSYFKLDDLARFPQLRPTLSQFCAVLNCTLPLLRKPSLIKLVSRDIRSHSRSKNALEVRLTFVNDAPYKQAYPTLQLKLSDIGGNLIATRRFAPQEYAYEDINLSNGIKSKQQVDVKLEILDPDKKAVGFEFLFF